MNNPRITDDGERVALGLEPIDDTPTPAMRARAIAAALWEGNPALADALRNQCEMGRSNVPQVRREALFFQHAHGLLLTDKEERWFTMNQALAFHDWNALWAEVCTMEA